PTPAVFFLFAFFAGARWLAASSVMMQRPLVSLSRKRPTSAAASSYVKPAASRPYSLCTAQRLWFNSLIRANFPRVVCVLAEASAASVAEARETKQARLFGRQSKKASRSRGRQK